MVVWLRKAKEGDCDILYNWVNDKVVRQNAFNQETITYDEHKKWFKKKLNSNKSFIYISMVDNNPIGQIRVDVNNMGIGVIDYSISKDNRGKGYGTLTLLELCKTITKENVNIKKLIGKVKLNNIPSHKAFEKAGFIASKKAEYIEYYKYI